MRACWISYSMATNIAYVCMGFYGAYNYSGLVRLVSGFITVSSAGMHILNAWISVQRKAVS